MKASSYILLFFPFLLLGQNHDYLWLTDITDIASEPNQGNILNFATYPPEISADDLNIPTFVTMATMCDQDGNLIFYSNGIHVMNADYEMMENGDYILTGAVVDDVEDIGYNCLESIFVLPNPGGEDIYYLFYNKLFYTPPKWTPQFYYSIVDMNLDNGKGAVVEKEILIKETIDFDGATATKHANGRDWWVIAPHKHNTQYFTFLLTPEGIVDSFTQTMTYYKPSGYPDSLYHFDRGGMNNFSPDGNTYVDYEPYAGIRIFEFDRCSGLLADPPTVIPFLPENPNVATSLGRAASISPNSRFLYISRGLYYTTHMVIQYDLWADDIAASADTIAHFDGFSDPYPVLMDASQLMPDGRIYFASYGYARHLAYISQPNLKGAACNLVQHGIELPNYYNYSKPHYPNYRLGPLDGSPCDTLGINNIPVAKYRYDQDAQDALKVHFTDLSYYEPATWVWDFGDGAMSTDTSPVHTFAAAGIYEVCLTVANGNLPQGHTFCQTLNLSTSATGEVPAFHSNLFPNPFRECTTLFIYDYLPADAHLVLYDAIGREVYRQQVFSGSNVLKPEGLVDGLYWYVVKERGVVVASDKVVKERGD
jgi:PKD domain